MSANAAGTAKASHYLPLFDSQARDGLECGRQHAKMFDVVAALTVDSR